MIHNNHKINSYFENKVLNSEGTVVFQSRIDRKNKVIDIEKEAIKLGWVTLINGKSTGGIYSYHSPFSRFISVAKTMIKNLAITHDFEEYIFPRHYTKENLQAFGWIEHEDLRQELMVIRPLSISGKQNRTNHQTIADPVQCLGFYTTLAEVQNKLGGVLPAEMFISGSLGVYEDQGGWTLRNELKSRLSNGWATAFEFSGAEMVFAGFLKDVLHTRWSIFCNVLNLLDQLELSYRVVVSTSCARESIEADLRDKEICLYEIPTLDIQMYIPQYENEDQFPWLELGGGDFAGTKLIDSFGIKVDTNEPLYSGCQGFGWQRFAFAFFSQKGFEPKQWPDVMQNYFGKTLPYNRIGNILHKYRR